MKDIKKTFSCFIQKIKAHKVLSVVIAVAVVLVGTGCGTAIVIATSGVKATSIKIGYNQNQKAVQAVLDPLSFESKHVNDEVIFNKEVSVPKDESLSLSCKIEPANSTFKDIKWSSIDEGVASIDETGNISAKSKGGVEIKAINPNDNEELSDVIIVKVVNKVDDLKVIAQIRNDIGGLGEITLDSEDTINAINDKFNNADEDVKAELKDEVDAMNAKLNELKEQKQASEAASAQSLSNSKSASSNSSAKSGSGNSGTKKGGGSSKGSRVTTGGGGNNGDGGNGGGNGGSNGGGGGSNERTWWKDTSLSNQVFALVNQYRQQNGVAPLAYNANCQALSDKRAEYNVTNQVGNHDHDQISAQSIPFKSAQTILEGWKRSPGHNKQVLRSDNIGGAICCYIDSNNICYCVLTFYYEW